MCLGPPFPRRNKTKQKIKIRTTLFAVMAADVIVLNLWAHDVGRGDGQAYSVLRSVFEEAIRVHGSHGDGEGEDGRQDPPVGGTARFPKARTRNSGRVMLQSSVSESGIGGIAGDHVAPQVPRKKGVRV